MRPDSSGALRAEQAAVAAAGLTVEPEVGGGRRRAATDSHLKSGRMSVCSISVTSHCTVREVHSGDLGKVLVFKTFATCQLTKWKYHG